ncbi:hypothetical protein OEA41_004666 [Lepraria neglecta]|uniref:PEBP-like protein n=1 Tax=Lepraria neglecta TaxID=209136 RepID=A0AAE0DGC6_9LECA|nr:hypothetical protein OEA41_004666 [Lepraria neglecta]
MLFLLAAVTCLVGSVLAQTPPSYTLAETNNTLGVKYGKVNVVAGETIGYKVPLHLPQLSSSTPLNKTYIAILVDIIANYSSPIPANLLWFQQDVTFSADGIASYNGSAAQVPYEAPSGVGHPYLALLYTQPPGFIIPPNFPYNNTFRVAFNVTRVGADFQTPLLEANYFLLGSNCTGEASATKTGGYHKPTATDGYYSGKEAYTRFSAHY